jgi:hypothetical protein
MKAILEFNLPEDKQDFNLATKASDWWYVCWRMDQYLRKRVKYDESITEDQREVYEDMRGELWRMMNESNVSFDEVE